MKKIVLAGPPRSGKTCIRFGLREAMRRIPGAPYPYPITANPDGEGAWFHEAVNRDPDLAAQCKAAYKSKFTPEFVRRVTDSVRNCALPLALVDIGGIPSIENKQICAAATHAVLLAGDDPKTGASWESRLAPWWEFCRELGLVVVAVIHSDYHGVEDRIEGVGPDGIFRASIHYLERGDVSVFERPGIQALAEFIVGLVAE